MTLTFIIASIMKIRVADNKELSLQSLGQVSLDIYNDIGHEKKVLFNEVLHVFKLETNLFS